MLAQEKQWQDFIAEAGLWFDTVHTPNGMQAECEKIAAHLEAIGYDDDFEAMCDYFTGCAMGSRETSDGKYESEFVYLAWGNPYITLDTATGEIHGSFGIGNEGTAFIGGSALRNINNFFRTLHDC